MRTVVLLLVIGVAAIAYVQQRQINVLQKRIAEKPQPERPSLAEQGSCSKQAERYVGTYGISRLPSYRSHYNPALNRCFVLLTETLDAKVLQTTVADAYESKTYGVMVVMLGKGGFKEQPQVCWMTLKDGSKKPCNSEAEFDELVEGSIQ